IEAKSLDQLLHPTFDAESLKAGEVIGNALPASPGAAAGKVYFTAEEAKAAHEGGARVILVRQETSPEDIEGMHASEGILTARGGMTSHAAVVARGMGTACVSGCGELKVYEEEKYFQLGDVTVKEGRSEEHTSELQSRFDLVCRLLLEKKNILIIKQIKLDI